MNVTHSTYSVLPSDSETITKGMRSQTWIHFNTVTVSVHETRCRELLTTVWTANPTDDARWTTGSSRTSDEAVSLGENDNSTARRHFPCRRQLTTKAHIGRTNLLAPRLWTANINVVMTLQPRLKSRELKLKCLMQYVTPRSFVVVPVAWEARGADRVERVTRLFGARLDYCNSRLHKSSEASTTNLLHVLNAVPRLASHIHPA